MDVEGRTDGARICVPAWNAVVTAKSEKVPPSPECFLQGNSCILYHRYRLHLNAFYKATVVFYTTGTDFNICLYMTTSITEFLYISSSNITAHMQIHARKHKHQHQQQHHHHQQQQHQQHHTLAQNNLCEFWCGMHLTCKNTPTTPDRNGSVKRPEKNWKGTIAKSSARWNKLTDCENRANREIWKQVIWKRHGGSWVGHIPCPKMKQVRDKGVPSSYHHGKAVSSLVDDCQTMHPPPA